MVVRTAGSARFVLRKCEREERSKALPRGSVIARPHPRGAHEHTTTCNVSARIDRQSDAPSVATVQRKPIRSADVFELRSSRSLLLK